MQKIIHSIRYAGVLLMCLTALSVSAQQLTLPDALQMAVQQNRSLQAASYQSTYAQRLVGTYRELPKTAIELQLGNIQNPSVNDYALTASQGFDGRRLYQARKDLLQLGVRQADVALELRKIDTKRQVRMAYYEQSYYQLLTEFLLSQDSLYRRAARKADIRYKSGETTQLEKIAFETQLQQLENRIQVARYQARVPYWQLKNLLAATDSLRFTPADFLRSDTPTAFTTEFPLLQTYEVQKLQNAQSQVVEKAQLRPSYMAGLTNQSMMGSVRQFVVTGGISFPFIKTAQKARLEALAVEEKMIDATREAVAWELRNQLEANWAEWKSIQANLTYLEQTALPQANALIRLATKLYEAGESNYLEYQQSFLQAASIRETYLAQKLAQKRLETTILYLIGQ